MARPPCDLGEGVPLALSPDKQWVLSTPVAADQLVVLPTGAGQPKTLPKGEITSYFPAARWLRWAALSHFRHRAGTPVARVSAVDRVRRPGARHAGGRVRPARGDAGRRGIHHARHRPAAGHLFDRGRRAARARGRRARRSPHRREPRRRLVVRAERLGAARRDRARPPAQRHARAGPLAAAARSRRDHGDPQGRDDTDARAYAYTFIRALSSLYLVDGIR